MRYTIRTEYFDHPVIDRAHSRQSAEATEKFTAAIANVFGQYAAKNGNFDGLKSESTSSDPWPLGEPEFKTVTQFYVESAVYGKEIFATIVYEARK